MVLSSSRHIHCRHRSETETSSQVEHDPREGRMAPILSHGQTTSGQCGFNQAASHPADPIKRHRARRERSHPKAMLTTQTSAVALDLLENDEAGLNRSGIPESPGF